VQGLTLSDIGCHDLDFKSMVYLELGRDIFDECSIVGFGQKIVDLQTKTAGQIFT
jgi:hypothetical protein